MGLVYVTVGGSSGGSYFNRYSGGNGDRNIEVSLLGASLGE